MARRRLSETKQDKALARVAEWLGPRMGYAGPAPTGEDAAYRAEGPMLRREWAWGNGMEPTPTILLEGGPEDWAIAVSMDETVIRDLQAIGVFAEPYAAWALCLYVAD